MGIDTIEYENNTHKVWHKFSNWLVRNYGEDLHGEWQSMEIDDKEVKFRSFNDLELSRRLVGFDVIVRIEKYIKKYCSDIKIVGCDDADYSSSIILLIPHPKHGITMMFIPQCSTIHNRMFLYGNHYKQLMTALEEMKNVY